MDERAIENGGDSPPRLDKLDDLLGKKSVRATFKLRPEAIEMLSILAAQLGIKQKSLFDYLMEDEDELYAIAESLPADTAEKEQRVQKTFVVSQKSLTTLEVVTKDAPGSRSELIERSIQRLLPVFVKERERQDKREQAFAMIENHFQQSNVLLDEIKQLVGKDDSMFSLIKPLMVHYAKAFAEIKILIDKGKRISELPIDALTGDQPER
jgi:hypothetical protein